MTPNEFLSLFWGDTTDDGRFNAIVVINGPVRHTWNPKVEKFIGQTNAYFAPSVYSKKDRHQTNAIGAKAFWLDFDVKDGHHESIESLIEEINDLVDKFNLPYPLMVKSGAGVHVYFLIDKLISSEKWKYLSSGLRGLCDDAGIIVDHKRTEDISSIMRLPDTINKKEGREPLPVSILEDPERPFQISEIKVLENIFKPYVPAVIKPIAKISTKLQDSADITVDAGFHKHRYDAERLRNSCGQIGDIVSKKGNVSEPLWYAMLQLVQYVENSDKVAQEWSEGHPLYTPDETTAKLNRLIDNRIGPTICKRLEKEGDKEICKRCVYRNAINTPLSLAVKPFDPDTQDQIHKDVVDKLKDYHLSIPKPYYVDEDGAILKQGGSGESTLIHNSPIFVYRRFKESNAQWYFSLVCLTPRDGTREIKLSSETLANPKSFYSELAAAGILSPDMVTDKRDLFSYIYRCAEFVWKEKEVVDYYEHYGWDAEHQNFNLGITHYTKDGLGEAEFINDAAATVPPDSHSLAPWRKVIEHYIDAPIAFRLAFFSAFASPLLYMTGLNGVLYSIFSPESGIGKTTVINCVTGVWGDPNFFVKRKSDTINSVLNFAGLVHNLPICVDEFSCAKQDDLQQFIYELSGGQEKGRLTKEIKQRKSGKWDTLFLATTNSSLTSQLPIGDNFEGVSARLIEAQVYEYTTIDVLHEMNTIANEHWGVLGHMWAEYIVLHKERLASMINKVSSSIQSSRPGVYRYYAAFIATVLVSMREIGQLLGIHVGVGKETLEDFVEYFSPGVIMVSNFKNASENRQASRNIASYHTKVIQRIITEAFTAGKYQTIMPLKKIEAMASMGTTPLHTYTVLEDREYVVVAESLCAPLRATIPDHLERVHILPGGAYTMDTRTGIPAYRISKAAVAGLSVVKPIHEIKQEIVNE